MESEGGKKAFPPLEMDASALLSCLRMAFLGCQGKDSLILQNHLYACFIVMEDVAQGILQLDEGHLTGNALYLNLETQFGQIGVRYYGFSMDGKAILEEIPVGYREAWLGLFTAAAERKEIGEVDRVEEEVLAVLEEVVEEEDRYFMNALEYEGNLSPDWVERALYTLHPHIGSAGRVGAGAGGAGGAGGGAGKEKMVPSRKGKVNRTPPSWKQGRALGMTRRRAKRGCSTRRFGAATCRRKEKGGNVSVRESPPKLSEERD